ncbi:MAG: ribonuclease III family protein [Thermofilaceae archaeon]
MSYLRLKELARFGDVVVNFIASAALTLSTGSPQGIRVPNRILRDVALKKGLRRIGDNLPEDLYEAIIGYAWLKGFSSDKMIRIVHSAIKGSEKSDIILKRGLSTLLDELLKENWVTELLGTYTNVNGILKEKRTLLRKLKHWIKGFNR